MINPNVLLMNNLLVLYVEDGKSTIDLSEITAPNLVALTRVNFNDVTALPAPLYLFKAIVTEAKLELARRYAALLDQKHDLMAQEAEHV